MSQPGLSVTSPPFPPATFPPAPSGGAPLEPAAESTPGPDGTPGPVPDVGRPEDPDFPGLDELFATLDRHGVGVPGSPGTPGRSEQAEDVPALAAVGVEPDGDDQPRPRLGPKAWIALLSALVLTMVALVALPRSGGRVGHPAEWVEQAWRGGQGLGGTGVLIVAPEPAARAVLIDGRRFAGETPARIDSIPSGRHRVTLDLGPCGSWDEEVTLRAGESVRVTPRLSGSVSVSASDAAAGGRAWIHGRDKVPVPAVLDSLPCGWNRIFYEDAGMPMWDRMVLIKPGKATRLLVPNNHRGGQGAVRVEALRWQGRDGLVESEGDTVRVDGTVVGATPLDVPLAPGLHSVRVGPVGPGAHAEVIEVKAGGVRSVLAQLNEGEFPALRHVAPGRVRVRGPILLTVAVSGYPAGWTSPTLHAPSLEPGLREVPMTPVEGGQGGREAGEREFVGVVNPESVPLGRELLYYFTISGPEGETATSDVFRLYPEAQWAGGVAAGRSALGRDRPAASAGTSRDEPPLDDPAAPAFEAGTAGEPPMVEPDASTDEVATP